MSDVLRHHWPAQSELAKAGHESYVAARICMPYCAQFAVESVVGGDYMAGVVADIIAANSGDTISTGQYEDKVGWHHAAIADMARDAGAQAVVQNLKYGPESYDHDNVISKGYARTESEAFVLQDLMQHGGVDKLRWLEALRATLESDGMPIVLRKIPSSVRPGDTTGHSVVVTKISDQEVEYFESDGLWVKRYEGSSLSNQARMVDESQRIVAAPIAWFAEGMTGGVIHILPSASQE